jgi:phosphotransacetylase
MKKVKAKRDLIAKTKPSDWKKKTADITAYRKEYFEANKEKIKGYQVEYQKSRPKKTPEQERDRYVKRMIKIHGPDWKPHVKLTPEQRIQAKKDRQKRKKEKQKTDPQARRKNLARKRLQKAVSLGKIQKLHCMVCGSVDVEGHHPDYDRPLDVVWLCAEHHRQTHAIPG